MGRFLTHSVIEVASPETLRGDSAPVTRLPRTATRDGAASAPTRTWPEAWQPGRPLRLLYVVCPGCRKTVRTVRRLLDLQGIRLTVMVAGDIGFRRAVSQKLAGCGASLCVVAVQRCAPARLRESHVVLAPGQQALVHTALAAGRPVIALPNSTRELGALANRLGTCGAGAIARRSKDLLRLVRSILRDRGYTYRRWLWRLDRATRTRAPRGADEANVP